MHDVLPHWLVTYAWLVGFVDAIVCAVVGGWLWHRKGGSVEDGIALGGIFGLVGLVLIVVLKPRHLWSTSTGHYTDGIADWD